MVVERLAHLPEGPALYEGDGVLSDVALGNHAQQLVGRDRAVNRVVAGLDVARLAEQSRHGDERARVLEHPRALHLLGGAAKAAALRKAELEWQRPGGEAARHVEREGAAESQDGDDAGSEKGPQEE